MELTAEQTNALTRMQKLVNAYNKLPQNKRSDYFESIDNNNQEYVLQFSDDDFTGSEIVAEILPLWCSHIEEMEDKDTIKDLLADYYDCQTPKEPYKVNLELKIVIYNWDCHLTSTFSTNEFMENSKEHC